MSKDDGRPLHQELHCENDSCLAFVGCRWDEDLHSKAAEAGWTSRPSVPGKEPGTRHNGELVCTLAWCPDCSRLIAEGCCLECLGTGDQLGPDPFNPPCPDCGGTGEQAA